MTTGKISHSPDYKSEFDRAMVAGKIGDAIQVAQRHLAERARLEKEVVKWAKEVRIANELMMLAIERRLRISGPLNRYGKAQDSYNEALTALFDFEREHGS